MIFLLFLFLFFIPASTSSTSEAETNLKDMVITQVFPQDIEDMMQTDTTKFQIPSNYEGTIY